MLNYEEARSAVWKHARPMPTTRVPLEQSVGHILAETVTARRDMPSFDQSAMDGVAVRHADVRRANTEKPVRLRVIDVAYAGQPSRRTVAPGTAIKIMTGGCVPGGADTVVMKEYCTEIDGEVLVARAPRRKGEHIRRRAEEYRKGTRVLEPGMWITPPVVGMLATVGRTSVAVVRKPKVAIVVTGDELRTPGERLRQGEIYDSNSYALDAALDELGITDRRVYRCGDDAAKLRRTFSRVLRTAGVVITVGGVSVGERDLVKDVFEALGVETVFWRVAIKPGKPNYFGVYRSKPARGQASSRSRALVFGLPGNPVSALVSYLQLVKPGLLRLMGRPTDGRFVLPARLEGQRRKKAGRLEWVRGIVGSRDGELWVRPTGGQESHMLGGLAHANCLIEFALPETALDDGTIVPVERLHWRR